MVLVILIALWAMVLLPPYLKDRRAAGRTFRGRSSSGSMSGSLPGISSPLSSSSAAGSAQRFLPLQHASTGYATSAVQKPTGMRAGAATAGPSLAGINLSSARRGVAGKPASMPAAVTPNRAGINHAAANTSGVSNVVQLRPARGDDAPGTVHVVDGDFGTERAPLATSAADYLGDGPIDEAALHEAWERSQNPGVGIPRSTAAARERRRHVLLGLTGLAFMTLLLAIFGGGRWIAIHVLVDVVMMGYVILLVRHRQLAVDRMTKIEPIRPPVNEQPPATLQAAPSYLLRSNTGS